METIVEILDGSGQQGFSGDLGRFVNLGIKAGVLDLSAYRLGTQVFALTTGASNLTLSLAGMPSVPTGMVGSFTLRIQQGATPRTLALDALIKESYALPPTLTQTANAVDLWTFMWTGLEWVCFQAAAVLG